MSWKDQIDNDFRLPSTTNGVGNGSTQLEARLVNIFDPRNGKVVGKLCPTAARSWNEMARAAWAEGVVLLPISAADTFRKLATQQNIFNDRYTSGAGSGKGCRVCAGTRYCKRKGTEATAACPGTSNHGYACAVDFQRLAGTLAWMERNAKSFGWQWELASEEWHVHYMLDDRVSQRVSGATTTTGGSPTAEGDDDMGKAFIIKGDASDEWWAVEALNKRYINTAGHAKMLHGSGMATGADPNGGPWVWPQSMINEIPTLVTEDWIRAAVGDLLTFRSSADLATIKSYIESHAEATVTDAQIAKIAADVAAKLKVIATLSDAEKKAIAELTVDTIKTRLAS